MNPLEKFTDRILHRIEHSYYHGWEKDNLLKYVNKEYQKLIAIGYDGDAAVVEIINTYGTIDNLCKAYIEKYSYRPMAVFFSIALQGSLIIVEYYFVTLIILVVPVFRASFPALGGIFDNLHWYALAGGILFFIPYTRGVILYAESFKGGDYPMAKTILALLFTFAGEKIVLFIFGAYIFRVNFLPFPAFLKETSINTVPWIVQVSYYLLVVFGCFVLGFLSRRLSKR